MNANFDTIYNDYNGAISAANLATNSVTTAKIADSNITTAKITDANVTIPKLANSGTWGSDWVWTTWAPTWTNLTIGNATTEYKYTQIGKTVHFRIDIVFGNTSAMGSSPNFTPPVTVNTGYSIRQQIGLLSIEDAGTASYFGGVRVSDAGTTTMQLFLYNTGATYATYTAPTSTIPMTWTTSDVLMATGTYEAA